MHPYCTGAGVGGQASSGSGDLTSLFVVEMMVSGDDGTRTHDPLHAKQGVATQVASVLLAAVGDNPERLVSEASFAALCGASPVDASSGKPVRHRVNRGGDRQANSALWRIAFTRMHYDERTRVYAARRRAEGKTDKEIIRCLKRYIAREVYKTLVTPEVVSELTELPIEPLSAAAA